MKIFFRLLSYIGPYRRNFFLGIIAAFFLTFFNGVSLTFFIPLFEALGDKSQIYLFQFSKQERKILENVLNSNIPNKSLQIEIPIGNKKIDSVLAQNLLNEIENIKKIASEKNLELSEISEKIIIQRNDNINNLNFQESILFKTIIKLKLKVNSLKISPLKLIFISCCFILPCLTIKLLLYALCLRLISKVGYLAVKNLRSNLYYTVQRLSLNWFYRNKSGEIISRLSNDTEVINAVFADELRNTIISIFYLITHSLILAYLNLKLLLVAMVVVPIILLPVSIFIIKIRSSTQRSLNLLSELHGILQETLSGMKVIRSLQMEKVLTEGFMEKNKSLFWRRFKEIYYLSLGPNVVELNSIFITLSIISLGALFLDSTEFSQGMFMSFIIALLFLVRPIIQLTNSFTSFQSAIVSGKRIFEIMDKNYETIDPIETIASRKLEKEIIFENVSFTYPESTTKSIDNVSFSVGVGETVAIVGESGGGKSTLMELLARFYKPTSGRILFDGIDINDFKIKDFRARIALVSQDIFLFHASIINNLTFGKKTYNIKDVIKAARLAHAHDFIKALDKSYHTIVGNRGLMLSGGQRQRIAIARALLLDTEILILDEATSALDKESENLVKLALERLLKNRTTFVIAHRLSTIEKADKIIVLSKGKVVEIGKHKDLIKSNGVYSNLYKFSI